MNVSKNEEFVRFASFASFSRIAALAAALTVAACAVRPEGESDERDRAERALKELDEPIEPAELPDQPVLKDYLRVAFHADPDLRERYWNWRAALERIPQEASPPNPAFTFSYLFSDASMNAWDRTTLGLTNDPMTNLELPNKLATRGRRALEEARAAGLRFEAAKFALQNNVTTLYLDLALHGEQLRAQQETVALLRAQSQEVASRVSAGRGTQEDALRAFDELQRSESQLETLHAQLPLLFVRMNVLIGRPAAMPLPLPEGLPEPRRLEVRDDELIALAAQRSPELTALAHEVAGRDEALTMARQQWIPDFGLTLNVVGSVSSSVGGMVVLPLRVEAIRGAIAEADANLRAAQAARERYARSVTASFVLDLAVLHETERQVDLFERVFLPRARTIAKSAEASLASGRAGLADVVMARRAAIDTALLLAQLKVDREKTLSAIDTWSEVDVEALHSVRMGAMAAR
jgi:outer membrane protein, heavy metal efflux system